MPRITRKQQKIFALNAANNGVFGSLQANDPTYSQDPDVIQGRTAYANGWNDATYSADLLPPLEEFQGLQYLFSRQLSYLFQEGVAEWNSATTYYEGSIVKEIDDGVARMYVSLADNNTNNIVSDTSKWLCFFDSSSLHADVSFSNIDSVAKNISNWSTNVTNCLTYIPQDIKLELNNGTLTLKAGSKVYVPNGSGVFDVVTISSDISTTWGYNDKRTLCYKNGVIGGYLISDTYSGSSAPSGSQYMTWYDTTNNVVKQTMDGGSTWDSGFSLPICTVTTGSGVFTSIDQVFNGVGFIGNTIFALPGIKGLAPNGRNENGTLNSLEVGFNNVLTFTDLIHNDITWCNVYLNSVNGLSYWYDSDDFISEELPSDVFSHVYIPSKNEFWGKQTGNYSQLYDCFCARMKIENGKIVEFIPQKVFRSLGYNDSAVVANFAMPSNKYIDLTLGASGATYIAPTNGYFYIAKIASASNQYVTMYVDNGGVPIFGTTQTQSLSSGQARCFLPVKKGDVVGVTYDLGGQTNRFCFVYAEGEV